MKANDMRQVVNRRKRRRRIHEQSFYQIISVEMKTIMKLVSNKKSTQILRNVDEEHLVQKNKAA
jgi:glutamyl-tRNA reductase